MPLTISATPTPSSQDEFLPEATHSVFKLSQLGFKLYATPDTSKYLAARGIANEVRGGEGEGTSKGRRAVSGYCRALATDASLPPRNCPSPPQRPLTPPLLQCVPYPPTDANVDMTDSPLLRLIKDRTVDLVINAAPPGKSSMPGA